MTKEKVLSVISLYEEHLRRTVTPLVREWPRDSCPKYAGDRILHIRWMLEEIKKFVAEDRMDKAFRWLGFVQGVLWAEKIYTIEEMANHNRS